MQYKWRLITMVYEFASDGTIVFTLTGSRDDGFFFTDNVLRIMVDIKKGLRREFRWRFGELDYSEASPEPRVSRDLEKLPPWRRF